LRRGNNLQEDAAVRSALFFFKITDSFGVTANGIIHLKNLFSVPCFTICKEKLSLQQIFLNMLNCNSSQSLLYQLPTLRALHNTHVDQSLWVKKATLEEKNILTTAT